jgi:hypothetical protein
MRRLISKVWGGLAVLACLLASAGCRWGGDEPAPPQFPAVATERRDPQFPDCPWIEGSYALDAEPGSQFETRSHFGGAEGIHGEAILIIERGPPGCSMQRAVLEPGQKSPVHCALHEVLRQPAEWVDQAARKLSTSDPERYRSWWLAARAASAQQAADAETGSYEQSLARHGPEQDQRHAFVGPECKDGWLQLSFGSRDGLYFHTEAAGDRDGGLLLRITEETSRSEIPLMCGGDGCAGIPLSIESRASWARLAPVERLPSWSFDARALPTPRPQGQASADPASEPLRGAQVEPAPRLPKTLEVPSAEWFVRVFELEDRIRARLTDERIDLWRPEGDRVRVSGSARDPAAVSALMGLIQRDAEVARAELVSIAAQGEHQRFALMVDLVGD